MADTRSDKFQPEHPHPDSKKSRTWKGTFNLALITALMVAMLFALFVPWLEGSGEVNWLLTLGATVVAFLATLGYGYARRGNTASS